MDRVLAQIHAQDEVKRVEEERQHVQLRLRRLGQVYLDGLKPELEYRREKQALEDRLASLKVPGVDAAMEAGKLLENLDKLWADADLGERRRILMAMLDAVYVDAVGEKAIVAIRAKPAFRPLLEIATTRQGSGIVLITQPPPSHDSAEAGDPCSWWRRGRVELHLKHGARVMLAGYFRHVDAIVMRVMDGIMAMPVIILAMALVALIGGSVIIVILVLPVAYVPAVTRVIRASVLSLREQMFVDAARATGAATPRILLVHVLPNTMAPLIVLASVVVADAMLVEAVLSFLGAGTPPDTPSWGGIMSDGSKLITGAMWVIIFPGIFLTLTVLGTNLAGDGLRDVLDPKLRRVL